MKKLLGLITMLGVLSSNAFADVHLLTARFAGGCSTSNSTGGCTIKVAATGSELSDDTVNVQHADSATGNFRNLSSHTRSISSGSASFRFKNQSGCYRVVTVHNSGSRFVRSRTLCEN